MAALVTLSMLEMRSEKKVGVSALGMTDRCFVKTPCTHAHSQRQRPVQQMWCLLHTLSSAVWDPMLKAAQCATDALPTRVLALRAPGRWSCSHAIREAMDMSCLHVL